MKITKTIRRVLLERETTGAQLAGRLGVTPSNISQKMIRDNWSVSDLADIAAALGCGFSVSFHLPDGQTLSAEQPALTSDTGTTPNT